MDKNLITQIKDRFDRVNDQIDSAKGNNWNQDIKVVVVSKNHSIEVIQAAIEAGITRFGENYVEEALGKLNTSGYEGLEWHMIGHVQSRKAASVVEKFFLIHSVDSLKLAHRLDGFCPKIDRILPILLEVNTSGEASKYGFQAWDEKFWPDLVRWFSEIIILPNLKVTGLMTMPPLNDSPEQARPYFKKTKYLQDYLQKMLPSASWYELSMGTSNDYRVAVEEGATYLRIGEAILGKRPGIHVLS